MRHCESFRPFARIFGALLFCSLVLFPAHAGAYVVDRVVAIVNNDIIKLSELNKVMKSYEERLSQAGYSPAREKEWLFKMREDVLQSLIERALVDQESERLKITIDDKDVDAHIEQIKKDGHFTEDDLREALKREGQTMEDFRESRREELLRSRLLERQVTSRIVITNEDVETYYNAHPELYGGIAEYRLSHVVIPVPLDAGSEAREKARDTMMKLQKDLLKGKTKEEVIEKYKSEAPTLSTADLGFFQLKDLTPGLQETIPGMEPGMPTGITETPVGFQVVVLEEVRPGEGVPMDKARPEIERKIYSEKLNEQYRKWLEDLKQNSYIKIIR